MFSTEKLEGRRRGFGSRWVLLITLLALGLRLWNLPWGAPERVDLLPDEVDYVMNHALRLMDRVDRVLVGKREFDEKTLDPVFLNYPSFLMYMIAGLSLALRRAHILKENWQFFLVGRSIVATFGALTVPVVHRLARELGASAAGALLAALWLALMPLHIWQSHAAVTDVLMTFWVAVTLWAALRLLRTQRLWDFAFAGVSLGLATGSKYTAAMAVVPVVLAALLARRPLGRTLGGLVFAAALSLLACFLVTPYSFIRLHDTVAAMRYESNHTTHLHYGFSVYAVGWQFHRWIYQLVAAAPFSLGFALYASCVAGLLWTLRRGRAGAWTLLGFAAVFYGVTGSWIFTPLRYYLPLLLVVVVFAGQWQGAWLESARRGQRVAAVLSIAVTLAYTALFSISTTAQFGNDTRMLASHWIEDCVAPGTRMAVLGWSRYMALPDPNTSIIPSHLDEKRLVTIQHLEPYDLIQVSSLQYARHYRHGNAEMTEAYDRLRDPHGRYELVQRFESSFINEWLYEKLDPMFGCYFISPTIEFYTHKGQAHHLRPPA